MVYFVWYIVIGYEQYWDMHKFLMIICDTITLLSFEFYILKKKNIYIYIYIFVWFSLFISIGLIVKFEFVSALVKYDKWVDMMDSFNK